MLVGILGSGGERVDGRCMVSVYEGRIWRSGLLEGRDIGFYGK